MGHYKFVEVSPDCTDVIVDAEFSTEIPPAKMQTALREICDAVLVGAALPIFFEGLSALHITGKKVEITFRFSRKTEDIAALDNGARDELPRTRAYFTFHVLARLDHVHELGSAPFSPNFREFINWGK